MIYGVGTDIINIERVEHILTKNKEGFVRRVMPYSSIKGANA